MPGLRASKSGKNLAWVLDEGPKGFRRASASDSISGCDRHLVLFSKSRPKGFGRNLKQIVTAFSHIEFIGKAMQVARETRPQLHRRVLETEFWNVDLGELQHFIH